jgi:hypothetical protein
MPWRCSRRLAAHLNHPDYPVDWCLATRRMAIAARLFDLDEEQLLGMNCLVQRFGALLVSNPPVDCSRRHDLVEDHRRRTDDTGPIAEPALGDA